MSQTVIVTYLDGDEIALATDGLVIAQSGGFGPTVEVVYPGAPEWIQLVIASYVTEASAAADVGIQVSVAADGSTFGAFATCFGGSSVTVNETDILSGGGGGFVMADFTSFFNPGVSAIRLRLINNDPGNDATMRRAVARFAQARTA